MLRRQALGRVDRLLGDLLDQVTDDDLVVLVSPAAPRAAEEPTPFAMAGHGVEPGITESGTTRRAGYVTLTDVAPDDPRPAPHRRARLDERRRDQRARRAAAPGSAATERWPSATRSPRSATAPPVRSASTTSCIQIAAWCLVAFSFLLPFRWSGLAPTGRAVPRARVAGVPDRRVPVRDRTARRPGPAWLRRGAHRRGRGARRRCRADPTAAAAGWPGGRCSGRPSCWSPSCGWCWWSTASPAPTCRSTRSSATRRWWPAASPATATWPSRCSPSRVSCSPPRRWALTPDERREARPDGGPRCRRRRARRHDRRRRLPGVRLRRRRRAVPRAGERGRPGAPERPPTARSDRGPRRRRAGAGPGGASSRTTSAGRPRSSPTSVGSSAPCSAATTGAPGRRSTARPTPPGRRSRNAAVMWVVPIAIVVLAVAIWRRWGFVGRLIERRPRHARLPLGLGRARRARWGAQRLGGLGPGHDGAHPPRLRPVDPRRTDRLRSHRTTWRQAPAVDRATPQVEPTP